MGQHGIFLVFSAFAAIVSACMWLDYFRRIDVFEKESIVYLVAALIIGGLMSYVCLFFYGILDRLGFTESPDYFSNLLYAIFGIGFNEELSKIIGVVITFTLFRKQINEPIDVMIYAGVTALGFSMVENYYYFNNHGVRIITSRTFYSALEHIINTSIIVYGFYRFKLFKKGKPLTNTLVAVIVAVLSHGLFDFFLTDNKSAVLTAFLSIIIYLVGINFWIQMLNNANNFSTFFDYDKIHRSQNIVSRLFFWYALTLVIAFINNWIVVDYQFSLITFMYGLASDGFLFFVVILRVSRFKIFKQKYFEVRPALPFYITKNQDEDFLLPLIDLPIKVRGENYKEHILTKYLGRKIEINPFDAENSVIKESLEATIVDKLLLHDDVIVYKLDLPSMENKQTRTLLLKPKTSGETMVNDQYPIEGLFEIEKSTFDLHSFDFKKMKFLEWVYISTVVEG
jgi:RsiW-degrading membrane proteinase PrsW (M82 family)